jgi:hypothetical protein
MLPSATCKPGWRRQENADETRDTPDNERDKKIWEAFRAGETDSTIAYPASLFPDPVSWTKTTLAFVASVVVELPGLLRGSLPICEPGACSSCASGVDQ